jgi:O-antigen/teichoic acid export membrane protein
MKSTFYSILSNFVARIWTVVISLIVLPMYTDILGFESYGLIGFFATLLSSLAILDLGLSATLSREMSRSLVLNSDIDSFRNMVFSIEIVYWLIGIVLGVIVIIGAPFIAQYWIKSEGLSTTHVNYAIMLMGGVIAFQWPQSIYGGGLMGLHKQVQYNIYYIIFNTLKSLGAVIILKYVSATIFTFFLYQIILALVAALSLKKLMWIFVPASKVSLTFSIPELKKVGRFAIGMTGVGLSTLILGQLDKIMLSKLLPLKEFGYYIFGFSIGSSIALLSGVLGTVLLPQLNQVVAKDDMNDITNQYHKTTKLFAAAISPPAILLFFFSQELLTLWVGNSETVVNTWMLVSLIAIGCLFNAYVMASYFLMIAYGWTKFTIYQNIVASIVSIPLLYFSVQHFGQLGGASICLVINFCYFLFSLPLIHRKLLRGELKRVYISDIAPAFFISLLTMMTFKYLYPSDACLICKLFYFSFAALSTYGIIILLIKEYREFAATLLFKLKTSWKTSRY